MHHENTVRNTVRKLPLFRVQVRHGADSFSFGMIRHHISLVDILEPDIMHVAVARPPIQGNTPIAAAVVDNAHDHRRNYRPQNFMSRLNIRRNRRLFRVNSLVVIQQRGGLNRGIRKISLIQPQLLQGAQHTVGHHAPQLTLLYFFPARKRRLMQCHRHQVPRVDIPSPRNDLHRLALPHVYLAYPHMVAVRVTLHSLDTSRHHVGNLRSQVLDTLHLGPR